MENIFSEHTELELRTEVVFGGIVSNVSERGRRRKLGKRRFCEHMIYMRPHNFPLKVMLPPPDVRFVASES
jgi:hypothetical protein